MRRRYRLLAMLAALALVAAACGGDDSSTTPEDSVDTGDGDTGVEQITLKMFDNETGEIGPIWDELIAEFEAANPGVTIERSTRSFSDYLDTVQLVVGGDDPPDIFQGNAGYSVDGPLIENGLVLNLDPYEPQYGWNALFGESALQINSFSEDGLRWGDGPLFGLSPLNEIVGVYYNKTIAADLGIEMPPASFADFEASLATAADAGVLPLLLGNSERFAGGHYYNVVQNAIAPGQENFNWVLGIGDDATFETAGNLEAANKVLDWTRTGYLNDDFNGLTYDDSVARFTGGEGLYYFAGSWLISAYNDFDIGFFVMPRQDGDPPAATGALSSPLHVHTKSEHQDLAVKFIDFLTNADAAIKYAEAGQLPAAAVEGIFEAGSLSDDVLTALGQVADGGVLVPYLDFATETVGETIFSETQVLLADRMSAEDYLSAIQTEYAKG